MLKLFLFTVISTFSLAWDYKNGGSDWTDTCLYGTSQSPIDLKAQSTTAINITSSSISQLKLVYKSHPESGTFKDQTYTIDGNFLNLTEILESVTIFMRSQSFSFHAPSEHTLNGYQFDLELQILSTNTPGYIYNQQTAVFFRLGEDDNSFIDKVIRAYGKTTEIDLSDLFGGRSSLNHFYSYKGSVTSPPCTEDVTWYIWAEIQEISLSQLSFFTDQWAGNQNFAGGRGNNRKIQNLNKRTITLYEGADDSGKNLFYFSVLFFALLY
ncbi:unnamed protein product [Blepharisma stoltei]|uniref:carbonic anhydrase n=1 Tax=Blepharisma stoltei TaxID=1481888 RepID=A0AAU9JBS5_9CILI|nr:unnamed protein product [Blepharisma stoltei]